MYLYVHVSFLSISLPPSFPLFLSPSPLSLSLPPSLSQISVGNSNDAIDFYHHDSSVRLSALRSLKSIIIDGSSCSRDYDQEFISSVLLSRLSDDDPSVVKAVLELGEDVSIVKLIISRIRNLRCEWSVKVQCTGCRL